MRVVNSPLGVVIVAPDCAEPNYADRAGRRTRFHPWENIAVRADVVDAHRQTPGGAFVGGMFQQDVGVVGITNVNGPVRRPVIRHFRDEEKVRDAVRIGRGLIHRVGSRRQSHTRRRSHGDGALARSRIDDAIGLMNVDRSHLRRRARGHRRPES